MSKIGKVPVQLNTAEVQIEKAKATIKGPKGTLTVNIPENIQVKVEDKNLFVTPISEEVPYYKMFWGLTRSLINNAVIGVENGFTKELELVGVGYRVEKAGNDLKILIGYSHPVVVKAPEGITFEVEGNTIIKVSGADKQVVGQISAEIRGIRKPEPYKGKGIKYRDEIVKRKK